MRPAENHGRRASHRSDCRSYMSDRREWEEGCETRGAPTLTARCNRGMETRSAEEEEG